MDTARRFLRFVLYVFIGTRDIQHRRVTYVVITNVCRTDNRLFQYVSLCRNDRPLFDLAFCSEIFFLPKMHTSPALRSRLFLSRRKRVDIGFWTFPRSIFFSSRPYATQVLHQHDRESWRRHFLSRGRDFSFSRGISVIFSLYRNISYTDVLPSHVKRVRLSLEKSSSHDVCLEQKNNEIILLCTRNEEFISPPYFFFVTSKRENDLVVRWRFDECSSVPRKRTSPRIKTCRTEVEISSDRYRSFYFLLRRPRYPSTPNKT